MDGVASVSQSVDAVNQLLMAASQKTMEQAEKMIKVTAEMALGQEAGKGALFDTVA